MYEEKDIPYISSSSPEFHSVKHLLDIFYPQDQRQLKSVLIFIHGGTWMSGSKDIYCPFGRNLAEKGVVAVTINYRLGDIVNFKKMALDCASAIKWVYENIEKYGGDTNKIFIAGHSAGGHLASLVSQDSSYFDALNIPNPIQGCILIDAFGLNIGKYIKDHGAAYLHYIDKVFTKDPETWQKASPVNYIHNASFPFLMLVGSKTYPFLIEDNERFKNALKEIKRSFKYELVPGKSHIEMIIQFEDKENVLYKIILNFLSNTISQDSHAKMPL